MAEWLGKVRLPIVRAENGVLRPVIGASIEVYSTLGNNLSPVTPTGGVDASASLMTLYSNKEASATLSQPLTTDGNGVVEFYAPSGDLHIVVTPLTGNKIGIPFYPHFGPHEGNLIIKKTTPGFVRIGRSNPTILGLDINVELGHVDIVTAGGLNVRCNGVTGIVELSRRLALYTDTADPVGQVNGECYYKTDTNQLRVFNGGVWRGVTLT